MKKLAICTLLFLASCGPRKITGYIVYKEFEPEHMCCDENHPVYYESSVIPRVIVPHNHHVHEKQEPRWTLFIGNTGGTEQVDVTKSCYKLFKVTDKVRVYGNSVELIKEGCK